MSRKDYKAVAQAFASTRPTDESSVEYRQWKKDVESVARVFAADNYRFNWGRFTSACEAE